jgi:uncharacterized membrane protein YoaK (UPF0700 family)
VTVSWSRSVGLSSEPHGPLPAILLALTFVTGLVDAASFLLLGHVFVANMTGNILFIGFALVGVGGVSLPSVVLATAFFGVGAMTGGRIIARIRHRGRALFIAAIVEAVLLGAAAVVAVGARVPIGSPTLYVVVALMALAMGARNAVVRWLAVPDMTTTVLTMTLTGVASDSPSGAGAGPRLGRRLTSIASMLLGGLVGALAVLHATTLAFVLPPVVLVGVAIAAGLSARSRAAWTRER